jgi:hypothetical protein
VIGNAAAANVELVAKNDEGVRRNEVDAMGAERRV